MGFMDAMNKVSSLVSLVESITQGGGTAGITLAGAGENVSFPVLPAEIMAKNPYNTQTVNINGLGDINMKGKRGLKSVTLASFFPATETNNLMGIFSVDESADPYGSIAKIRKMAESTEPSAVNVAGTDISMPVLIKNLEYGEKDGTGDVYFSVELEEYRFISQESSAENETTGLKSRGVGALSKATTITKGMDAMEAAHRAVQNVSKNISLAKQGLRKLQAVRSIVRGGGLGVGMIMQSTAQSIKAGKLTIKF